MNNEQIAELINRRRRQILVHSFLYYQMDVNLIADHVYDRWSKELAELQRQHPDIAKTCVYAEAFAKFDGSSGFDLPFTDPKIQSLGTYLLRIHNERT